MQSVSELNHSQQGQRLVLLRGEIAELEIIEVALTNRPRPAPKRAAFWIRLDDIHSFAVLEKEAS